jgi:hypoxanthine-guanine phosphoribosyltransferase
MLLLAVLGAKTSFLSAMTQQPQRATETKHTTASTYQSTTSATGINHSRSDFRAACIAAGLLAAVTQPATTASPARCSA